jgi:prepilin-type N-terminal cleavage/methylation domain-containing protein/prepilin-type processing-associated H-X9-DG protein
MESNGNMKPPTDLTIQTGTMTAETSKDIKHSRGAAYRSALGTTRSSGFTLTELLVVILIIAVLSATAFTVAKNVMAKAHQAGCVAVMRQVGIATAASIQDNNDRMPAPIVINGQIPNYTSKSNTALSGKTLFSQLAPYLGLEEQSRPTGLPDSLVCPAFRKRFPGWNANGQGNQGGSLGTPGGSGRVFYLNQDLMIAGKRVFGPQDDSQAASQPDAMTYSVVSQGAARTPVSKIVMLMDFEPIMHGESRNFLFLDFHVESLPNTYTLNPRPQ